MRTSARVSCISCSTRCTTEAGVNVPSIRRSPARGGVSCDLEIDSVALAKGCCHAASPERREDRLGGAHVAACPRAAPRPPPRASRQRRYHPRVGLLPWPCVLERRRLDLLMGSGLALAAFAQGCGGQGSSDATPIPSTGVPMAAASARGVDVRGGEITPPHPAMNPSDPHAAPPPTVPVIPPDPFAPPVSPPPVPPAPTSTGVPL